MRPSTLPMHFSTPPSRSAPLLSLPHLHFGGSRLLTKSSTCERGHSALHHRGGAEVTLQESLLSVYCYMIQTSDPSPRPQLSRLAAPHRLRRPSDGTCASVRAFAGSRRGLLSAVRSLSPVGSSARQPLVVALVVKANPRGGSHGAPATKSIWLRGKGVKPKC